MTEIAKPKSKRGFASMTPERRREIAASGGRSVKPENRAYSVNRELARIAGYKGGIADKGGRSNKGRYGAQG